MSNQAVISLFGCKIGNMAQRNALLVQCKHYADDAVNTVHNIGQNICKLQIFFPELVMNFYELVVDN